MAQKRDYDLEEEETEGIMVKPETLHAVLNAKTVSVVGASSNPDKTGYQVLKNILDAGYQGRIYPINLKAESILDINCYPSLLDVPEDLDLVVIVVPAAAVPEVMQQAADKNARGAVIISGGFREIGNVELENEVMGIANAHDIAVIGPNCQGINYTPNNLCACWPLLTKRGGMAVIAQSGTIGATMGGWAEDEEIGFSALLALGNKSGVGEIELLDYFASDEETKVIALNIEGVKDGRAFIKTAKSALSKKPVVVLKPGRTRKGAEAAQSHTKSIAGSDKVFEAVCQQTGLIRAEGICEFYDYSKILSMLDAPLGKRMLVVTSSGGSGILAADVAEDLGIELRQLPMDTKSKLKEILPNQCVVSNPLDLTGDATANRYMQALDVAITSEEIDCILVIFGDPVHKASDVVRDISSRTDKPIVVAFLGGGDVEKEEVLLMHQAGIPAFPTPERAVRAIGALLKKKNY